MMLAACGGGKSATTTVGAATTVTLSPSPISIDLGQVVNTGVEARDANANLVNAVTITYETSAPNVAQVANNGAICGGRWDSLTVPVVCTPGNVGTANITAKAGGITSNAVPVSVHRRIASLIVTATAVPCTSSTKTQQFTVVARAADGTDITSTVGTVTFSMLEPTVGTFGAAGLATAKRPGLSSVVASVSGVTSIPSTFITCPPASILIKEKDVTPAVTDFTLAPAAVKTLTYDVIDTLGQPITDIQLFFTSSQPTVATVNAFGAITAVGAGNTGIIASCTPPVCNPGLNTAVYSNLATVAVSGTSSTTVYVTGSNSTTIVPIDTTTNTAGTAINVPTVTISGTVTPLVLNSFVIAASGTRAFIGADKAVVIFDTASNTVSSTVTNVVGKVLAVSQDGRRAVVHDATGARTYIFDVTAGSFEILAIPAAVAAEFSADSYKAYIVGGTNLYVWQAATALRTIALGAAANDVSFLTQGSFAYLAGGAGNSITARAACDDSLAYTVATAATPLRIESRFDSTRVISVDNNSFYDLTVAVGTAPCPPTDTHSITTVASGLAFTPKQLLLTGNGTKAFVTSELPRVLVYDLTTNSAASIPLATGTAATTGGITNDSRNLYVGVAGTNDVHRIDVATLTDAQQIAVNLKKPDGTAAVPDLVAVRPK